MQKTLALGVKRFVFISAGRSRGFDIEKPAK